MNLFKEISRFLHRKHLLPRFWQSASEFWHAKKGTATSLAVFLIAVTLIQLLMQILLNLWNRRFFDALERRDAATLAAQARMFIPLVAVSAVLAAAAVWGRMTAQRKWRESLTHHIIDKWLAKDRFRRLNHYVRGTENPEYRIAVDVRIATDAPIDLALAFFSSVLTALAFFGVLWEVGGNIDIFIFNRTITIPAYLVIGVVIYSSVMSSLMIFFGHHLTGVIESMNQAEAEFRAAVDAFREETRRKHDTRSDVVKRKVVWRRFPVVLGRWKQFCWQLVRTTLVSHSNFLIAPVVGWLLCVPKYSAGAMTLGQLTQAAAAFVTVQTAFNWLVDNFQRIADWRASAHRVATLLIALDEVEAEDAAHDAKHQSEAHRGS